MTRRREFVIHGFWGVCGLTAGRAWAAGTVLSESDPQARALAYVADTRKVDPKKYPKHAVSQRCDNCALYQGNTGAAFAACALFAGKQVAGAGWCSAYARK